MKKPNIFKYLGPGILVTVGFIDPGNWATNLEAGSTFGYSLLWVVSVSTIMLILLQHNAAHLGIATGKCLAENAASHLSPSINITLLGTAFLASISTALAEILGGAIALNMIFGISIKFAAIIILLAVLFVIYFNNYKKLEKIIIAFVAIIGFSFFYEITLFKINWLQAFSSAAVPTLPQGSIAIIVGVLGAVVMPHNLFLHSEVIQSREWHNSKPELKKKLLKYEFLDTIFSMVLGWAINCTIIILAAEVFHKNNILVTELSQAADLLKPVLGSRAAVIFAIALLFAGFASSITAGVSGGTISAGIFNKEYNEKDGYTKIGVISTLVIATFIIIFIDNPLKGLIYSQIILSLQLPFTIFLLIYLTSSKKVMHEHKNTIVNNILLVSCGLFVTFLNILLLIEVSKSFFSK